MVLWGLEVILGIRGHQRSFRGAHGSAAPPPHPIGQIKTFFLFVAEFVYVKLNLVILLVCITVFIKVINA